MRALILDYGEVLSFPQSSEAMDRMAVRLGAPNDRFREAYWRHRHDYDMGLAAARYWAAVADELAVADRLPDVVAELIGLDVQSWTRYRDAVWTLASTARRAGIKTAVLSNGVPEIMAQVARDRDLQAHFDTVVVSCEVGCAKPEPAIYELTLARLGVSPSDALFVDDRADNIAAARTLGLDALHFVGDDPVAQLQARLTDEIAK
jgi:putative hydrolase of the HAD superfamily